MSDHVTGILDAVDQCEDTSVHRELLKALLEVPDDELRQVGPALYELGLGLCADSTQPVAMVHVGVQLLTASGCDLGEEVQRGLARTRRISADRASCSVFVTPARRHRGKVTRRCNDLSTAAVVVGCPKCPRSAPGLPG